ncbi:GntR family transcriptional regulator [Streptomyces sp. NBC_01361]|uniref:GntR family transcriptional regulator n=1 Tax=Streptomyces sp. NBC_01361 TaxID=2903838 RepID=UPI002E32F7D5|nr:GntR family transcriptional regulator [Streptomyces sp. NBC_01361]
MYRQIADALKAAIDAGQYGPGDRLPGENPLAAEHGVAVMTARQALRTLASEGVAEPRKGAGFFVLAPFKPIRWHGIARLAREQWGSGASIFSADDSRPLTVEADVLGAVTAPDAVVEVLQLRTGERAFARSRRHLVEGRPVLVSTSYLPLDLAEGTPIASVDTGPGGIYARLADQGVAPEHFREEIQIRTPSDDEMAALNLSGGTAVIKLCRTAYTADGRAVEVNDITMDSQAYVLEYNFDA